MRIKGEISRYEQKSKGFIVDTSTADLGRGFLTRAAPEADSRTYESHLFKLEFLKDLATVQ